MLKFRDVLSRWERRELSMMEAGELLGMSERQFRRYRERFEEEGEAGLIDRRLGQPSPRRIAATETDRMIELYRTVYRVDEDAAACGGPGRAGEAPRSASSQAREEALRGHDAASGRLTARLAGRAGAARSDRHDGWRHQHDLFGVAGGAGGHDLDIQRLT